jgi:hypothetical protein
MSGEPRLEQRYRRVLRLLPGYYRERWEEDMVAAFLDSWLTSDPCTDECVLEFRKPAWQEVASVVLLAARLYLGGAGAPRRYFAWGQAVRCAVLALLMVHAVRGLDGLRLVFLAGAATRSGSSPRRRRSWRRALPGPPRCGTWRATPGS